MKVVTKDITDYEWNQEHSFQENINSFIEENINMYPGYVLSNINIIAPQIQTYLKKSMSYNNELMEIEAENNINGKIVLYFKATPLYKTLNAQ